jgi:hypothetical protein
MKKCLMKDVELQKLFNFVGDNFFIWIRLRSQKTIYTQLVVICGQKNYKLDTKHAIGGVVEEGIESHLEGGE